ncbi:MAG TPA: hypothetical protein VG271_06705 [Beijerinckiaceae bacterium]|nr:hypothetical protein [Beijerinckiaceae bacterium]
MASPIRGLQRAVPLAALALSLGYVTATPARAADDGQENFFSSVWGMIGGGIGVAPRSEPTIDYHERAPLVLPPKTDLPPPGAGAAVRNQSWPQDPDVLAAKKAQEEARAPHLAHKLDPAETIEQSRQRSAAAYDPLANQPTGDCLETRTCDPATFWSLLKNTKKGDTAELQLIPGQEPPREYLTQPPPGYMSPTKAVKVTQSAPQVVDPDNNPEDNPSTYFRDQKEKQYSPN